MCHMAHAYTSRYMHILLKISYKRFGISSIDGEVVQVGSSFPPLHNN